MLRRLNLADEGVVATMVVVEGFRPRHLYIYIYTYIRLNCILVPAIYLFIYLLKNVIKE